LLAKQLIETQMNKNIHVLKMIHCCLAF